MEIGLLIGRGYMNKHFFRCPWIVVLCLMLWLTACSSEAVDEKPKKKSFQAATEIEGMLREGPGKFAGDRYDEEKVNKALRKLPDDLTADQAYTRLIQLLAEDYGPALREIEEFDPSLQIGELKFTDKEDEDQKQGKEQAKQVHVEILLDASGSMAGRIRDGVKMDLAKEAIENFVSDMPENAKISLRVYGHKGSNRKQDQKESCASTEVVYPHGPYVKDKFGKALNSFEPTGWTPLAAAMEEARQDLKPYAGEDAENIIYVVSDGIETCGGDPVKAAKSLHNSDIQAVVNIIGFDVDDAGQQALKKVAEAGGGEYKTANTREELNQSFGIDWDEIEKEVSKVWYNVDTSLAINKHQQEMIWEVEKIAGDISYFNQFEGGTLYQIYDREVARLEAAVEELDQQGKLSDSTALTKKVEHRYELMKKYRMEQYEHLESRVEKVLENAEKKRDENLEK